MRDVIKQIPLKVRQKVDFFEVKLVLMMDMSGYKRHFGIVKLYIKV